MHVLVPKKLTKRLKIFQAYCVFNLNGINFFVSSFMKSYSFYITFTGKDRLQTKTIPIVLNKESTNS